MKSAGFDSDGLNIKSSSFYLFYESFKKTPEQIKMTVLPPRTLPITFDTQKKQELIEEYSKRGALLVDKSDVFHIKEFKAYFMGELLFAGDLLQKATGSYENSKRGYNAINTLTEQGSFGELDVTAAIEYPFYFPDGRRYLREWIDASKISYWDHLKLRNNILSVLHTNGNVPMNSNLDVILSKSGTAVVIDWESEPFPPFGGGA